MARIVALIPDLLFGSRVMSALQAAGHEVELTADLDGAGPAELLIVDLTVDAEQRIEQVAGRQPRPPVLAFYAHVEADVRGRAKAAGLDLVVPRSRMAREAPTLAERLLAG